MIFARSTHTQDAFTRHSAPFLASYAEGDRSCLGRARDFRVRFASGSHRLAPTVLVVTHLNGEVSVGFHCEWVDTNRARPIPMMRRSLPTGVQRRAGNRR